MIEAIERGHYARFALATPDGDQTVEVFFNVTGNPSNHPDGLAAGFYWQNLGAPFGPFDSEQAALDAARAHYGYTG